MCFPYLKEYSDYLSGKWKTGEQICRQWDQIEGNYREPKREDTCLEQGSNCGDGMIDLQVYKTLGLSNTLGGRIELK